MAGVDLFFGPMLIAVYQILYLFIVETANLVIECGIIYEPLIIRYGTKAAVTVSPRLLPGVNCIGADPTFRCLENQQYGGVLCCVIVLNTTNPTVITRSFILPGFIALVSIGSFAAGINMAVKVFLNPEFQEFGSFIASRYGLAGIECGVRCCDCGWNDLRSGMYTRKTGFSTVDGQINRIIRLTLETGSLTAIAALLDVTFFLVFPVLLAMLNSRDRTKSAESKAEQGRTAQSALRFQSFHSSKQTTVNFPAAASSESTTQSRAVGHYEHEHRSAKHSPYPSAF
ncbi:hypothetical protein B0H14DRAFT_2617587 [Mycena olivaceomarginata]|nr:hypothetical protein B0H14DRAFT_2617587 [Mycena olivaceomarginata]